MHDVLENSPSQQNFSELHSHILMITSLVICNPILEYGHKMRLAACILVYVYVWLNSLDILRHSGCQLIFYTGLNNEKKTIITFELNGIDQLFVCTICKVV